MQAWEVDVKCPICLKVFRMNRMKRHVNRSHADLSLKEFEGMLLQAAKIDPSILNTKRVPTSGADATGTQAVERAKRINKEVTGITSGGAIGLGKRK